SSRSVTLGCAFEIGEEEKFVLAEPRRWTTLTELRQHDWTTERIAELRQNVLRVFHLVCRLKEVARPEAAVRIVKPTRAVKIVTTRFDTDVDRCATRESLFRVEGIGDNIHFL